jgi:hypothetical protein
VIGPGNKPERLKVIVAERLQRLWPQIGPVEFDYVWNGYVGMTTDFLPRIHRLGPDAYGWTGCRVGMLWTAKDVAGQPLLHHLTVFHDSNQVANLRGHPEIVG